MERPDRHAPLYGLLMMSCTYVLLDFPFTVPGFMLTIVFGSLKNESHHHHYCLCFSLVYPAVVFVSAPMIVNRPCAPCICSGNVWYERAALRVLVLVYMKSSIISCTDRFGSGISSSSPEKRLSYDRAAFSASRAFASSASAFFYTTSVRPLCLGGAKK